MKSYVRSKLLFASAERDEAHALLCITLILACSRFVSILRQDNATAVQKVQAHDGNQISMLDATAQGTLQQQCMLTL
jgi:hypothetical protein